MVPWAGGENLVMTGKRIPCLYMDDPDDAMADGIALAGHPSLIAAVSCEHEPEWEYDAGVDPEGIWDAVMTWMEKAGHPVSIEYQQEWRWVYIEP